MEIPFQLVKTKKKKKKKHKLTGGKSISAVGVSYSSVPSYGTLRSWTGVIGPPGVGLGAPLLSMGPITTPAWIIFASHIYKFTQITNKISFTQLKFENNFTKNTNLTLLNRNPQNPRIHQIEPTFQFAKKKNPSPQIKELRNYTKRKSPINKNPKKNSKVKRIKEHKIRTKKKKKKKEGKLLLEALWERHHQDQRWTLREPCWWHPRWPGCRRRSSS